MDSFTTLGLCDDWVKALRSLGIDTPTKIQQLAIPPILERQDVFTRSETGSGKTLCYLLPILNAAVSAADMRALQAIILTPTHELASQVHKVCESIIGVSPYKDTIKSALIIGGASITRQIERLKEKPQIVIGSTGRILELIQAKKIRPHTVKTIVIDEADRMFDPVNRDSIAAVIKTTLKDRQLLMFSASLDERAKVAASALSPKLSYVQAQNKNTVSPTISHLFVRSAKREKMEVLRKIIAAETPASVLVFLNSTDDMDTIRGKLLYHHLKVASICGETLKNQRRIAIENFRAKRIQILLSSDISARGLDFSEITHVINFSVPEDPLIYLHRCGRCGRNGKSGTCISLATDYEEQLLFKAAKKLGFTLTEKNILRGMLQDCPPKGSKIK